MLSLKSKAELDLFSCLASWQGSDSTELTFLIIFVQVSLRHKVSANSQGFNPHLGQSGSMHGEGFLCSHSFDKKLCYSQGFNPHAGLMSTQHKVFWNFESR